MPEYKITEEDYKVFQLFLEEACGIALGDNKQYLVQSRLQRLLKEYEMSSVRELTESLKAGHNPILKVRIIDAMTTNETLWFRDRYPYEILKIRILPEVVKKGDGSIRIWSAACSSGQEPYSIAISIEEAISGVFPRLRATDVQIVATDISPSMLENARSGIYDDAAMARGVKDEQRQRFFEQEDGNWQIKSEIRKKVIFKEINLQESYSPLGKFDVIFCRNVLIYFSSEKKRDILERMSRVLNPGGYLILGASEALTSHSDAFEMIRGQNGSVYRLKS